MIFLFTLCRGAIVEYWLNQWLAVVVEFGLLLPEIDCYLSGNGCDCNQICHCVFDCINLIPELSMWTYQRNFAWVVIAQRMLGQLENSLKQTHHDSTNKEPHYLSADLYNRLMTGMILSNFFSMAPYWIICSVNNSVF